MINIQSNITICAAVDFQEQTVIFADKNGPKYLFIYGQKRHTTKQIIA